jgi:tetratricopeptide (TPR) repeat protein
VVVVCTLAVLSAARVYINGPRSLYQWTHLENHIHHLPSLKERVLSYAQSHYWYLMKLLYPRHLCFDYGFACIPTIHSFCDLRNCLSLLAYGLVCGTVFCAIRFVSVPLFVGLGLLIIPLVPALSILFPVGTTLAERLLFIPSAGYCLMVGELLTQLNAVLLRMTAAAPEAGRGALSTISRTAQPSKSSAGVGVGVLRWKYLNTCLFTAAVCAMFSVRVFTRNRDWNSEAQIYKSALQVCPLSAKALTNYAVLHMSPGQFHNSVAAALASVEVYGEQSPAWLNAGVAQQRLGFQARSAWYYDRSLHLNRGSSKMLGYLGVSLYEWAVKASDAYASDSAAVTGLRRYAAYVLDRSLAGGFSPPTILHTRGSLAMDEGEYLPAIEHLEEALRLTAAAKAVPDVPHADLCDEGFTLNQLGNIYSSLERYEDAYRVLSRGLEFSPREVSLLTNLGSALRSLGRLDEAREVLLQAVDIETGKNGYPSIATLNNLGLVELDAGLYDEAALLFQKAVTAHEEVTIQGTLEDQDYKQLRSSLNAGLDIGDLLVVNLNNAREAQKRAKNPARLLL